jgi:hypothetical protein
MVAIAFGLLFQPQKVIMTDLPHTVGIIEEALSDNKFLKKGKTAYEVQGLCWGKKHRKVLEQMFQREKKIDLVICSELVFDELNTSLLFETLELLAENN